MIARRPKGAFAAESTHYRVASGGWRLEVRWRWVGGGWLGGGLEVGWRCGQVGGGGLKVGVRWLARSEVNWRWLGVGGRAGGGLVFEVGALAR